MRRFRVEVDVPQSGMNGLRPVLEDVLGKAPSEYLSHAWDGDVLRLSGPGARGTVFCEGGRLCVQAQLGLPASLFGAKIEQLLTDVLEEVAARAKSAQPGAGPADRPAG